MVQRQFIGTTSPSNNLRQGNILVLTLVSLIAVFAFVAFSIDIGALVSARSDLQNAADAAARAGARHLPEDIGTVETVAKNFTEKNPVADKIITLEPDEDLEIGFWNTKLREFTVLNKSEIQDANAVRTTIRMNQSRGNSANLFFAPLLGIDSAELELFAIAAIEKNIRGFKTPDDGKPLPILPFAIDLETWDQVSDGLEGPDRFGFNSNNERIERRSDGISEFNLFPTGNNAPGNRGFLNLGSNGGTNATIDRQIREGLGASDFDFEGGQIDPGENSKTTIAGQPGVRSVHEKGFESITGELRIVPVFGSVDGSGSNATYEIVKWAGLRIVHVDFGGSPKQILAQPEDVFIKSGAIAREGTDTTQSSDFIFTKPKLVE